MKSSASRKPWFESWFDSPHYHRLYGNRDNAEAQQFINRLHLEMGWSGLCLLDLACGKGRHARAAAELGHEVMGLDLSVNSIRQAERDNAGIAGLNFVQGDMRSFDLGRKFDGILNLFTSFGYFNKMQDHMSVLESIAAHLSPNGFLVLDFLDTAFARNQLVPSETLTKEGVTYHISRDIRRGSPGHWDTFIKTIRFEEEGQEVEYIEEVAALTNLDLSRMLEEAGFQIDNRYGDYLLAPWFEGECPRLIMHARKR